MAEHILVGLSSAPSNARISTTIIISKGRFITGSAFQKPIKLVQQIEQIYLTANKAQYSQYEPYNFHNCDLKSGSTSGYPCIFP